MIRRPIDFDNPFSGTDNGIPVEIKLALLADAANLSREGKLNILGAFTSIYAPEVPARHPEMQLVLNMDVSPAEAGQEKKIDIKLLGEDGENIGEVSGIFMMPKLRKPGRKMQVGLILPLRDTVFPKEGSYQIAVVVDGRTEIEIPLTVILVERQDEDAN
jgi:hypothetical protein